MKVLFIQGLEKSLNEYIKPGIGGLGDYYKENTVPRVLGYLNLQRERFRDNFPFCLVFLLPPYALKYFMLRGADFFDWRSGFFKFDTEEGVLKAETTRLLSEDFPEYLAMTPQQRREKWLALETCLEEAQLEEKAGLLVQQANLFVVDKEYLAALAHYDKVLALQPEYVDAWYNRCIVLRELGRWEEALASYKYALLLQSSGNAGARLVVLIKLGRYRKVLASLKSIGQYILGLFLLLFIFWYFLF